MKGLLREDEQQQTPNTLLGETLETDMTNGQRRKRLSFPKLDEEIIPAATALVLGEDEILKNKSFFFWRDPQWVL